MVGGSLQALIQLFSLHAHTLPAGGFVTVDGQQFSEKCHKAQNKMPSDGFTIKSRIRNLLRSPATKQKKNRKENLTSKVCMHHSRAVLVPE